GGDALAEDRPADRAVAPWPSATRLWVKTSAPGAQAPRVEWARRLLARLKDTDKTIVWFDLLSGALESQLGVWAEMVMRTIEYDDDHSGLIGTAAGFVQNSRERGWRSLCGGESFIIAILDPPASGSGMAFAKGRRSSSHSRAIIPKRVRRKVGAWNPSSNRKPPRKPPKPWPP